MDLREGVLRGEVVGREVFGVRKTQVLIFILMLIKTPPPLPSLTVLIYKRRLEETNLETKILKSHV